MSRVEVLVATINQKDLSLFEKMNIQTDVIFCNQCDINEFIETEINGCRVRMLSTTTRGVGINRNIAMQLSNAEICLCADDDIVYVDGYENIICKEFDEHKNADAIEFNRIEANNSKAHNKKPGFTKNGAGACRLAYRNDVIKIKNVSFSSLFGGGAKYSSGEDSLFVKDMYRNKCKIYVTDKVLGKLNSKRDSTWFKGYNKKFFFDKGAWCKAAYPKMWRLYKYYLVLKQTKLSNLSYFKVVKLMNQGAKAYKLGLSYEEFNSEIHNHNS